MLKAVPLQDLLLEGVAHRKDLPGREKVEAALARWAASIIT
jgi:hypothetical protein